MNKILCFIACFLLGFVFLSCMVLPDVKDSNYHYPIDGHTNNAAIAVKDYTSLGIIFVKSSETIDGNGNHTGSKITFEMLMQEAQKLNADDIINVKIDVNPIREIVSTDKQSETITKTTYNYTATALAIKYTNAIPNSSINTQEIGKSVMIQNKEEKAKISAGKTIGLISGIILPILGIILLAGF